MIDRARPNHWYVSGVLCAAIVFLFAVAALVSGSDDLLHWFMIPVAICGIVIGADAASWITGEVGIFDPIGILGLFGVHFFLLAPLLHVHLGYWTEEVPPPADWRPWLGAMAVLNLLGLPGIPGQPGLFWPPRPADSACHNCVARAPGRLGLVARRRTPFGRRVATLGLRQLWRSMGLYLGGGTGRACVSGKQLGRHGRGKLPNLGIDGLRDSARRREPPSWPMLLGVLLAFAVLKLLFGGLQGSRSNTVFALFWAVGIVHFCIRPVPKKLIFTGTAVLVLFMYLYGFYKSGGVEGLQRALESSDARNQVEQETHRPLKASILGDLGRSDIQAAVLYRLASPQSDYQYGLGRSYLGGLLTVLPGPVWRNRPPTKVREGTEALYGRGAYRERPLDSTYDRERFSGMSSAVYGLAGEAMLNFGPLAVPLSFAALGLAVGLVRRWAATWRRRDVRWLLMPFLVNLCLVVLIGDSDNVVALVMGAGLVPLLVLAAASRRIRRAAGQHLGKIRRRDCAWQIANVIYDYDSLPLMNESRKPGTIVHFVANIDGGVWSIVKTLASFHRPRWRVMLVGVHAGKLRPAIAAAMAEYFDGIRLVRRPAVTGAYYLAPVGVAAAIRSLGVDPHAGNFVAHFHTGPYTSWVYRLPRNGATGNWLVSFHGSRGSFGDLHNRVKCWMHVAGVKVLLERRLTLVAVSHRSARRLRRDVRLPGGGFSRGLQRHRSATHGPDRNAGQTAPAVPRRFCGHRHGDQRLASRCRGGAKNCGRTGWTWLARSWATAPTLRGCSVWPRNMPTGSAPPAMSRIPSSKCFPRWTCSYFPPTAKAIRGWCWKPWRAASPRFAPTSAGVQRLSETIGKATSCGRIRLKRSRPVSPGS